MYRQLYEPGNIDKESNDFFQKLARNDDQDKTNDNSEIRYCFVCWKHHQDHRLCMRRYLDVVETKDQRNHQFKMAAVSVLEKSINAIHTIANGTYETQIL